MADYNCESKRWIVSGYCQDPGSSDIIRKILGIQSLVLFDRLFTKAVLGITISSRSYFLRYFFNFLSIFNI